MTKWWAAIRRELGAESQPIDTVVRLIILERGARASVLLLLGIGLLTDSRQLLAVVREWVSDLDLNPGRGFFGTLAVTILRPVGLFPTRTVVLIAIGTIVFAFLEFTEAIGLARRRRWAEYLTVLAGTIGIPFEVRAVMLQQTTIRISFLVVNLAIVIYLAWQKRLFGLRRLRPERSISETPAS